MVPGTAAAVGPGVGRVTRRVTPSLRPLWPRRRPSGIPEADLRSALAPYLLQQRDALRRRVRRQEAENRRLAEAVVAGRLQVQELQRQGRARQEAWQVSPRRCPRAHAPGPGGHDLPEGRVPVSRGDAGFSTRPLPGGLKTSE